MSKYENCVQAAMAQWRNFLNISIMKNETEVFVMKDKTYHAYLDSHERQLVIHMLGFGIVQIGLSLKSHDPSQRANGFLTLAGGVVIY